MLCRRYSVEKGAAAAMHDLEAAHKRVLFMYEGVVDNGGTLTKVGVI